MTTIDHPENSAGSADQKQDTLPPSQLLFLRLASAVLVESQFGKGPQILGKARQLC